VNCIIVDDEETARAIVFQLCETVPDIEVVAQFPNAIEALKFLNHNTVDLIFLDIHMPGLTGFDFIETSRTPTKVVLTTSDKDFAIEAYGYETIVDYLVKPIERERFEISISKVRNVLYNKAHPVLNTSQSNIGEDLYINIDRRLIKLKYGNILFIEAKGDYIEIKTIDTLHRVHSTLKKIKEKLPDTFFLQLHRSFIINVNKIIDIQDNSVLIDRSVIPISRSNRPELMRRLNLL